MKLPSPLDFKSYYVFNLFLHFPWFNFSFGYRFQLDRFIHVGSLANSLLGVKFLF